MKQAALFMFVLLLACIGITAWYFWQDMQTQLNTPLNLKSEINFIIKPGMNLNQVGDELINMGLLAQPHYLMLEARRQEVAGEIKAGEYIITPGTTPIQLLEQFVMGKVVQHALTIVEGWNFSQLMDAVANNEQLVHTLEKLTPESLMNAVQTPGVNPEGQFFPDTYHFPADTTDVEFLRRAHDRLQHILAEEWAQRAENLPYQSSEEALIMASIIEKETGLAAERSQIAGVFVRRLEKNMLLQTDPTIIYAMGNTFNGNIQRKDLKIDSPYNTYVNPGLPPTPIALAGREAIHAVLHPAAGNSLYFVAKGDGSHYFSETLKEHNQAVAKYQLSKRGKND
jgi:UPF0755 protein